MNKSELVNAIVANSEEKVTKKQAEAVVNAYHAAITDALKQGDKVQLIGFGTFESKVREARIGRNPSTGAEIQIARSVTPAFKAGAVFKKALN